MLWSVPWQSSDAQMVLQQILMLGTRLAEPGEFTRRAFLNGRLDLMWKRLPI